jgi:hypothetical protein
MKYIITEEQYNKITESELSPKYRRRLSHDSIDERIKEFLNSTFVVMKRCKSLQDLINLTSGWVTDDIIASLFDIENDEEYFDAYESLKPFIKEIVTKKYKNLVMKKFETLFP